MRELCENDTYPKRLNLAKLYVTSAKLFGVKSNHSRTKFVAVANPPAPSMNMIRIFLAPVSVVSPSLIYPVYIVSSPFIPSLITNDHTGQCLCC